MGLLFTASSQHYLWYGATFTASTQHYSEYGTTFYSLFTTLFGIWDYFYSLYTTLCTLILILCLSFSQLTYSLKHWPHAINLLQWFPKHQTFAVGLTMAGFGGSGIAFNQIITSYINPDNLSPDYITKDGERLVTWPRHFIIFESFCL